MHELRHTIMGYFLAADIDLQQWLAGRAVESTDGATDTWRRLRSDMEEAVDHAATYLAAFVAQAGRTTAPRDEAHVHEVTSLLGPVDDTIHEMREKLDRTAAPDAGTLLDLVRRLGAELQSVVDTVERGRRGQNDNPEPDQ